VPLRVAGDPQRLRQILLNLMGNAVKFTNQGSVDVTIEAGKRTEEQVVLILSVRDTGPGIDPAQLNAIFDEFTQLEGTSQRHGGTGLGLAITRKLVELHGGAIRAESVVGEGSLFVAEIIAGTTAAEPETPLPAPQPAPPPRRTNRPDRVLVVEDNEVNQKVVRAVLTRDGIEVDVVSSGVEALEALEKRGNAYDLVIMDIQMPAMDGITAARRIRLNEKWRDLPIVALTAHAMQGDRERCLAAGMNGYLAKPVVPGVLIETVRSHINASRTPFGIPAVAPPALAVPSGEMAANPTLSGETPIRDSEVIDIQAAARFLSGDLELLCGMTELFLQVAPERLAELEAAALRADHLSARAQALKLKGASERIGATGIAQRSGEIADAASEGRSGRLVDLVAVLKSDIARLDQAARRGRNHEAAAGVAAVA
jgi:CheY-like chemotaxis protein/HPt (histidine-containing phosphotransfer) domain-containing protein